MCLRHRTCDALQAQLYTNGKKLTAIALVNDSNNSSQYFSNRDEIKRNDEIKRINDEFKRINNEIQLCNKRFEPDPSDHNHDALLIAEQKF